MVGRKRRGSKRQTGGGGRETLIFLKKKKKSPRLSQKELIKTDIMENIVSAALNSHQFTLLDLKARLKKMSLVLFLT